MLGALIFCTLFVGELTNLIEASPLNGAGVEAAKKNEFPFIASLQSKVPHNDNGDKHFCTGTLITIKVVITAAHCIEGSTPDEIQVLLGNINVSSSEPMYNVTWMLTYDQWAHQFRVPKKYYENDLAILRLSNVVWQLNINPAIIGGLPTAQLYKSKAVIAGWGYLTTTGKLAKRLRKANVDIFSLEDCKKRISLITNQDPALEQNQICTAAEPFVLTSRGDSGSPLLDTDNKLIGITYGGSVDKAFHRRKFSVKSIQNYEVNVHFSIECYREFISSVASMP